MPVIITIIIAMLLILISWVWHNLGNIEPIKKIFLLLGFFIIIFIITFIIFNISKTDIKYDKQEELEAVRNVLVMFFTIINGLIIGPSISKTANKVYEKEIDKNQLKNRIIAIVIIFLIVIFIECGYMKSIQQEILKIYNNAIIAK